MGDVDGADEVDVENAVPIGGVEIPEGEPELPGTGSYAEDDVIDGAD